MKTLLAASLLLSVAPAYAHFTEPVPSGWDDWAMRQKNIAGDRCCDPADVYLYKGAWRYEYNGAEITGVTLLFDASHEVFVPKARFLDRERDPNDINPTGAAVIWYREISHMYCFDPPGTLGLLLPSEYTQLVNFS